MTRFAALAFSFLGGFIFTLFARRQFKLQALTLFFLSSSILQALEYFILTAYFNLPTSILQVGLIATGSLVFSCLFKNFATKALAIGFGWLLALFHFMGLLQPGLDLLRQVVIKIGPNSLTLLALTKALIMTSFFIWTAITLSNSLEARLKKQKHLHPSLRIIFSKLFKTMLITVSIYIGFSLLGIDLSALTFLAGAIGVGIAFGLQNILSNFFCGFILLMDRSITPGDVISIQEGKVYGVVNKLHARYVSIRTREGKEHLIPNLEIVSNKLENWSYSDPNVRLEIPFKVSYHSDLELVEKLLIDIAQKAPRVLSSHKPTIRFRSINENSVELLLRFWISDPENGMSDIRSHIIFQACKAFKAHHIKIPYPPREIHSLLDELRTVSATSSSASAPDK